MLPRTLEPEGTDDPEEARAYDAMDHSGVGGAFAEALASVAPDARRILDLGAGTAHISIELCRRVPSRVVVALDLARSMLALGAFNVANCGMIDRVLLVHGDAKALPWPAGAFDAVVSNSLVHHVPDTERLFAEVARISADGPLLFRDLARPETIDELEALVERHARNESPLARSMFRASLHAALTPAEVRSVAAVVGLRRVFVEMTSDRHWTLTRLPGA